MTKHQRRFANIVAGMLYNIRLYPELTISEYWPDLIKKRYHWIVSNYYRGVGYLLTPEGVYAEEQFAYLFNNSAHDSYNKSQENTVLNLLKKKVIIRIETHNRQGVLV